MYICTFVGIAVLGYVRVSGAERARKLHDNNLSWTEKEKKLLFLAFGLIGAGLVLAFI